MLRQLPGILIALFAAAGAALLAGVPPPAAKFDEEGVMGIFMSGNLG